MHPFLVFAFLPTVFCSSSLLQQKLSISNDFLVTSIGVGQPGKFSKKCFLILLVQNFDLALELDESKLIVVDRASVDDSIDYQYDYIKMLYDPIDSNTAKLTDYACRHQYSSGQTAKGIYAADVLTVSSLF